MGRGKIEIKMIENPTNRQVTYSKRRNGIFKKAQELTVLCDAQVSLITFSKTGKFHEFTSPSTTTKKIYDQYQKAAGIDLWSTHYERMKEQLKKLQEINRKLRREIRQRIGEDLDMKDVDIDELRTLEQKMDASLELVRERKFHVIKTQTDTYKKKVRNLEQRQGNLLLNIEAKCEDPHYGLVDNEGVYESSVEMASGSSNLFAFHLHQSRNPSVHLGGAFGSPAFHLP